MSPRSKYWGDVSPLSHRDRRPCPCTCWMAGLHSATFNDRRMCLWFVRDIMSLYNVFWLIWLRVSEVIYWPPGGVYMIRHGHGLGWPMGWVGLGRVRSNMNYCQTALVNIISNHKYFSERDFSAVSRTITDARSRLSPKTVEAMELIRWAVPGSLLNMDD